MYFATRILDGLLFKLTWIEFVIWLNADDVYCIEQFETFAFVFVEKHVLVPVNGDMIYTVLDFVLFGYIRDNVRIFFFWFIDRWNIWNVTIR